MVQTKGGRLDLFNVRADSRQGIDPLPNFEKVEEVPQFVYHTHDGAVIRILAIRLGDTTPVNPLFQHSLLPRNCLEEGLLALAEADSFPPSLDPD